MSIYRIFVEKTEPHNVQAKKLRQEIKDVLSIDSGEVRIFLRYDVEGLDKADFEKCIGTVFAEPPLDVFFREELKLEREYFVIATEFLPGQYDQRADSAEQCVQLATRKNRPVIRCANIYAINGITAEQVAAVKNYLINPVEMREAKISKPDSLAQLPGKIEPERYFDGFISADDAELSRFHAEQGFAMTAKDLLFVRDYFKSEKRNPSHTELKVIDTYWSDHCRHTTFLTKLSDVKIDGKNKYIKQSYDMYLRLFDELYKDRQDKYPCLMDIATIGAKKLKLDGYLEDIDESEEINACSIKVKAEIDGKQEDWLVMFKNETHNHPTEIEPYGGAATCIGGAIRDPLSGRVYVYQAMRVTGCGNPYNTKEDTPKGKLLQRVITRTAAAGFSSYGNQIGLATGIVAEIYHKSYIAKRMEAGFVVGAAPMENVHRSKPQTGDVIVLLGGDTGRDGCGGATGSSKAHDVGSVESCGAEVQKGNPLTERKIQRLFLSKSLTKLIKKCNDFGAGGVCVAIGELSDSLDIDLDAVPTKYSGLSGTEVAISESQERMAAVIASGDLDAFIAAAAKENLNAVKVAAVTDTSRLRMFYRGEMIVDLSRAFLDTNGASQQAEAHISLPKVSYLSEVNSAAKAKVESGDFAAALSCELSRLNVCSQKGMGEMFDSTIGSGSIYLPFGGKKQLTPALSMAAKLPTGGRNTQSATVCSYAYYPDLSVINPYIGSIYAVVGSVAKLIASGADRQKIRLTFQEFFPRLGNDPKRWGQPVSALLGALSAQLGLKTPAIGGKDSMSGTFEDIDVPPTLISFALAPCSADKLITNVLEKSGTKLYCLSLKRGEGSACDFDYASRLFDAVHAEIKSGNISFATALEEGGAASAVAKSCLGNGLGFAFKGGAQLFYPLFGDLIVSAKDIEKLFAFKPVYIGETNDSGRFSFENGGVLSVFDAEQSFTKTLEPLFPTTKQCGGSAQNLSFAVREGRASEIKTARPRVFIPVFPGTNCELDTAAKFAGCGADVQTFVIKNRSASDIEESVREMSRLIDNSQIIAFPGGFSGGDEPDGSGKFIAATFKNPLIKESVERLLNKRDGLILGICNGFQALIKLSLLPLGKICDQNKNSPTLTFNTISRHVSTMVNIRVASNLSPWLSAVRPGEVYSVAVSHGEGRFVCDDKTLAALIKNGQIATQYSDGSGNATMLSPENPNGSVMAVEGITSPCGRILGKMGHSERTGENLYKNYGGNFDMKIFESGVNYFK